MTECNHFRWAVLNLSVFTHPQIKKLGILCIPKSKNRRSRWHSLIIIQHFILRMSLNNTSDKCKFFLKISQILTKWLRENNIFAEIGDYAKILFSHSKPEQSYCAKIIFSQSHFHGCQVVANRRKAKWGLQNVRGWK